MSEILSKISELNGLIKHTSDAAARLKSQIEQARRDQQEIAARLAKLEGATVH